LKTLPRFKPPMPNNALPSNRLRQRDTGDRKSGLARHAPEAFSGSDKLFIVKVVRDSVDADIPTVQRIYAYYVMHGLGLKKRNCSLLLRHKREDVSAEEMQERAAAQHST